ncbi:MAG: integrase, partial [Proteobacteria bacterium]
PIHQNPFYWAERLRNWQEKYNPIIRRTSWTELKSVHIPLKSPEQLATYPDACFLFRMRESPVGERHLPMTTSTMNKPWFMLLSALQERLQSTGQYDLDGTPFVFVPPYEESNNGSTAYFPLQSLRVSLITALALDGMVPFPILQKLVGHSRLLMTLYYTKLGPTFFGTQLEAAAVRMDENKAGSIKRFTADAKHDELMKKVVYNSSASLKNAIPEDPGARNPAGWMLMHHGMCIVGGNTSEVEENKKIGGCHNGGSNVGTDLQPKWAPVPGGSRNCVRCRWFVTQPQYLPSLVATFNNRAYHFDEARNSCLTAEERLQDMRRTKFELEASGNEPFQKMAEFLELERVYEAAMKRFSDLAETLVATWRLIDRCSTALKEDLAQGNQLIAVGAASDISTAFEETESELLQLSGVCEGA